jgi:hypothetical protein
MNNTSPLQVNSTIYKLHMEINIGLQLLFVPQRKNFKGLPKILNRYSVLQLIVKQ